MTKPRVLMFAPHCYPPADAESIVTAKLVLAMIEDGWHIDIITREDVSIFYRQDEDPRWDAVKRVVKSIKGKSSLMWAIQAFNMARKLMRINKYDFIFSRVAPQYGHLPALLSSYICDIPWIAHWSDPMPSVKAPPPYGQGQSAKISLLMSKYFLLVSQRAAWHIFPSERLRNYICSYLPACKGRNSIIPHIASDLFRSTHYKGSGKFILCHAGGLGIRRPDTFLTAAKQLLIETGAASLLQVVFIGVRDARLQELVNELDLSKNVTITEPKNYQETLKIVRQSTVAVVIEAPCFEGIFFPSKFVDYVQTGRPILAVSPKEGVISDMLALYGGGLSADVTSVEDITDKLKVFYLGWQNEKINEQFNADKLFVSLCNWTVIAHYLAAMNHFETTP